MALKFINRLPATCDLAEELTLKPFADGNWFNLGQLVEGRFKASYRLTEYTHELYDHNYC